MWRIDAQGFITIASIFIALSSLVLLFIMWRRNAQTRIEAYRYHMVFEENKDAIFLISLDGKHIDSNPRAIEMFGYPAEEIVGMSINQLIAPDEIPKAELMLKRLMSGEKVPIYERRFRHRNGTIIPAEVNAALLYDHKGKPLHIQSILHDITARKSIEEQLRLRSAALEAAANGIVITDRAGIIQWANPAFTTLTGYTVDEAVGKNPRELVNSGHHDKAFFADMWQTILAGETWHGQLTNRRKDGSLYTEEQTITPVRNDYGEITHFIAIKQDITARKEAEQRAFELAFEQERVRILARFIQDTSHEFRTPLAVIQSSLYFINKVNDPEIRQQKSAQIEEQAMRLANLLDMLVKMTHLDSGIRFDLQPTNINTLLKEISDELQAKIQKKQLSLHFEFNESLPPIKADSDQLWEAFYQLIDNAIRFTPAGGSIKLVTHHLPTCAKIEIHDTGSGIPEESKPRIFERFYRLDTAHTTPGFGLGLAIAHKIIVEHGGLIDFDSTVGAGTVFRVSLPTD